MELCELYKYVPSHILNGCLLISLAQEEIHTEDEGPVLPVSVFYTGIDCYFTAFRFVPLTNVTPQSLLQSKGVLIDEYGPVSGFEDHTYDVNPDGTIATSTRSEEDTLIWMEPHIHVVPPNLAPPITIPVSNIHNKDCTQLYVLMLQRGGGTNSLEDKAFGLLPSETMGSDVLWVIDVGRGEMHLE
eukprot:PhF_6_TR14936/c1_g1_i2/m.23383